MSNEQKDEEMICALTAEEAGVLRRGLNELPETMPPHSVWLRIREQAEAEGLLKAGKPKGHRNWYAGAGLAAAVVLAVILIPATPDVSDPNRVVPLGPTSNQTDMSGVRALMVQSQQLERDLRSLPAEPRVGRAGTVATISDIEDRIAAIDYQLNDPDAQMAEGDKEIFWRERVRLMKLLLQLRYAQAQRAAF